MSKELEETRNLFTDRLMLEIGKWIVGYKEEIRQIIICLLAGGPGLRAHVLLEGVPGLAKTKLAKAIAKTINGDFKRIQGTPDLFPADITGVQIWDVNKCCFEIKKGPVFANILLFDEINRTSPRTQSALLEAMQEGSVTLGDITHLLPELFMVLATQNPIEHDGTFILPKAQEDRFMMKIRVGYAFEEEEMSIVGMGNEDDKEINKVFETDDILKARTLIRKEIMMNEGVQKYIVKLVRATRPGSDSLPEVIKQIDYGASPRAMKALEAASRAYTFLEGRNHVVVEDVDKVALPILRHRITVDPTAVEGNTNDFVDDLLRVIIKKIGGEFR